MPRLIIIQNRKNEELFSPLFYIEKCRKYNYHIITMYYELAKVFGANIKRLRKNRNLSQEKFAEVIGMQLKSVVNFETGRNIANSGNLQKICAKLEIPPAELFMVFPENPTSKEKIDNCMRILNYMSDEDIDISYSLLKALMNRKK